MTGQPLEPFALPAFLLVYLPSGISAGVIVGWILYAVFAFWALYTLVAVYHWIKYSHASWVALPAIALHLLVSLSLMFFTLTGTRII